MIEHSLVNLIQNSIHALGLKTDPQISIKTSFSEDEFSIEVYDNGCGIPENHLEDIFTPSFTLKGTKTLPVPTNRHQGNRLWDVKHQKVYTTA
jgi:C4-dicarboxylate-specific signal transduction histidine kinase